MLNPGVKLGGYEIVSLLGQGGMGEVYRARDTKLGREVALKVLPEAFTSDAERMARFEREAKVLASLNHPNIAAIYGFEDSNGAHALVMELVEGPTLAERIAGSGSAVPRRSVPAEPAIPVEEALPIARQIADAMEYAHERGIVHRDLKPANVKITPDDTVKLLDFGLAKALENETASGDISNSPTISRMATQAGVILGTAAYMSPEQAKGRPVDRRADIWAFGCVLYEMLTGKQAFRGETLTDVLAAVMKDEPDWSVLPKNTPTHLRVLLQRCLQKDPKLRLRDIGDARIVLDEVISGVAEDIAPLPSPAAPVWRGVLPWAIAGLCVAALVAFVIAGKFAAPAAQQPEMHFSAVTDFAGVQAQPAFSPDGRSVAFVSNRDGHYNIYVGLIGGGNLVQVTNDPNLESRPMWSPDGTRIAYARLDHSGIWDIWEVPALGGTPRRVILNAKDPAWSPDGHSIAYGNMADGAIWLAGISGENAHRIVSPPRGVFRYDAAPRFSPDGRQLAFVIRTSGPHGELCVADLASGKVRQLTHDAALVLSPVWSPDGQSIYFASSRGGTVNIWKIAATGGVPEQITSGQGDDAQLDVSSDGKRIVFSTWRVNQNIARLDLDAKPGQQSMKLLTTDPARGQLAPVYSPDGKRLAYFTNLKGAEKESIWISNADGSDPVQLVKDGRVNVFPRWTPDGQHLIFFSEANDFAKEFEYRSVPISGGSPQTVFTGKVSFYHDVGTDGRILFRGPGGQVEAVDPRDGKVTTLATLPASEAGAPMLWSPDERSIAYIVAASKEDDPNAGIWVDDFKNPPHQIFRGWADWWLARGPDNEIYFIKGSPDLNGTLWKIGWNGQGLKQTSATIPMNDSYWQVPGRNGVDFFAISPDGRYVAFDAQPIEQANIGMIENLR